MDKYYEEEMNRIEKKMEKVRPFLSLPGRPDWMRDDDGLMRIYNNFSELKRRGKLTYACIVQANVLLFEEGAQNHPASVIYTQDVAGRSNPEILVSLANELYQYKSQFILKAPRNMRKAVKHLKSEYDRGPEYIDFSRKKEYPFNMYLTTVMIYREHLIEHKLDERIYPVLYLPDKPEVVMLVPETRLDGGGICFA